MSQNKKNNPNIANYIKCVAVLSVICVVVAVLLAAVNFVTDPIIAERAAEAAKQALAEVLPGGEKSEKVDIAGATLPASVLEVYRAENGGHVVKTSVNGYGAGMIIMCGIDANGVVVGTKCLESKETNSAEKTYGERFLGTALDTVDAVDTVSGSTLTTTAYKQAIKDSLNVVAILGGAEVDLRTEEEILADNLNEALPSANGEFEKLFIVEDIEGISDIYTSKNLSGAVYVVGETFIGVDADGNVITDASEEERGIVTAAAVKILSSSVSELDLSTFENIPKAVEKAYITESGNYVLDIKASGYGITGDKYTRSGEYIRIKVSLTPDGKIIDCLTVSQKESENIGDKCADPAFYSQFDGKTVDNYKEIDAISGATVTTNGYTTAILRAFETLNILKGDA